MFPSKNIFKLKSRVSHYRSRLSTSFTVLLAYENCNFKKLKFSYIAEEWREKSETWRTRKKINIQETTPRGESVLWSNPPSSIHHKTNWMLFHGWPTSRKFSTSSQFVVVFLSAFVRHTSSNTQSWFWCQLFRIKFTAHGFVLVLDFVTMLFFFESFLCTRHNKFQARNITMYKWWLPSLSTFFVVFFYQFFTGWGVKEFLSDLCSAISDMQHCY